MGLRDTRPAPSEGELRRSGVMGEAAVIAYDSRIRVLQDFTNDSDKLSQAVKKI